MAKQGISTGTTPNDGSGDSLLASAIKINSNFNEIYTVFGNGATLSVPSYVGSSGISSTSAYATNAGIATLANTATLADTATLAEGLTGSPTISVGDIFANEISATSFSGDGSNLTGVGASVSIYDDLNFVSSVASFDFKGNLLISGNINSGIVTVTSPGYARSTFNLPTGVLGIGQTLDFTFIGFKSYTVIKANASAPCRLILYTDHTSQVNDAGRLPSASPTQNTGVITDIVGFSTEIYFTPPPIGFNADAPVVETVYATIENTSGISTNIILNLTLLPME